MVAGPDGRQVQQWICKACGRHYRASYRRRVVLPLEKRIASRLLELGVAARIVARALEVSDQWVYILRRRLRDDALPGLTGKEGTGSEK